MDDGALEIFVNNKSRYKKTVLDMLDNSTVDSFNANASFLFAELLLDDNDIKEKITELSSSHPEKEIRCFWYDVVNNRFELVKVIDKDNGIVVKKIKDKGSICK